MFDERHLRAYIQWKHSLEAVSWFHGATGCGMLPLFQSAPLRVVRVVCDIPYV